MYNTLKQLINAPSVSGREDKVRSIISEIIGNYVDEQRVDNLGNLIAIKRGQGAAPKKIMLCAHMDEIGFLVTFIEESGYLRVSNVGGINFVASAYSEVVFENGTRGVIVPEAKVKAEEFKADKFYIDIGAKDRKDAEKKVKIGDFAVVAPSVSRLMGRRICGRPFDDRIGCAILIEIAKTIEACENDLYFVFSVQEEVGCRGAKPAAFGIAPDYAIVFDVTGTGDSVGSAPMAVKIGGGAAIKVKDSSVICHSEVVDRLTELAKANKIKHQHEILTYGGTDTSSIQVSGSGAKVGALSIPSRNIHSGMEIIDVADAEACQRLAIAFINSLC